MKTNQPPSPLTWLCCAIVRNIPSNLSSAMFLWSQITEGTRRTLPITLNFIWMDDAQAFENSESVVREGNLGTTPPPPIWCWGMSAWPQTPCTCVWMVIASYVLVLAMLMLGIRTEKWLKWFYIHRHWVGRCAVKQKIPVIFIVWTAEKKHSKITKDFIYNKSQSNINSITNAGNNLRDQTSALIPNFAFISSISFLFELLSNTFCILVCW